MHRGGESRQVLINKLDFYMFLDEVFQQMRKGDYSGLKKFVDDFGDDNLPKTRGNVLRVYGNYCVFRECCNEMFRMPSVSESVNETLAVLGKADEGDARAREDSLEFISYLMIKLEGNTL